MRLVDENRELFRNMLLYGIIGCLSAGTDTLVFLLLTSFAEIPAMQANLISVPLGILISFLLNRHFNFRVKDHPVKRGSIFFGVGLFGLCISQGILWIGTTVALPVLQVKVVSIAVVAIIQFALNKLISFGLKL